MQFNEFYNLLQQYSTSRKCIHCEGYISSLERLKKDAPGYFEEIIEAEVHGFLNCAPCQPLEILDEYLNTVGRRRLLRPRKKKLSIEDFSVKLFLRKIMGDT